MLPRLLDRDGLGLAEGETRAVMMLREFILETDSQPSGYSRLSKRRIERQGRRERRSARACRKKKGEVAPKGCFGDDVNSSGIARLCQNQSMTARETNVKEWECLDGAFAVSREKLSIGKRIRLAM